ncbi:hypothetical protein ASD97_10020 [Streptomyces sp. Root63]|uniref:hypothetical protein n=1 Tax=unclassified Streptomyces TaxID=2593676 RepID=UPI0006F7A785|nr:MULTISPECIES: hypothetical protein [unclassified Streptomyces]KQX37002.1 hypothetical protein ASD29_07210 [Streptomyces sp. Root1295]KRA43937.1 hypothetical protein ASD97_10020 [Streptomyces sp. Root63]
MTVSLEKPFTASDAVNALERQIGQLQAQVSNLRSAVEEQKEEALHARSKYGKLRMDARQLLIEIIEDYDLDSHRGTISELGEQIGLDALQYEYNATVTVTFSLEGLRKTDGSDFSKSEIEDYLVASIRANAGGFELDHFDTDEIDIDLELQ